MQKMDQKEQEKQSKQSEQVQQEKAKDDNVHVMAKAASEETGRNRLGRWKMWFRKRWVPPVVYLAVAAIIFTIMWQLQDRNDYSLTPDELGISVQEEAGLTQEEAETVPVTGQEETMIEPYRADDAVIVRHYFDETASDEENAKAMVRYGDSYSAHTGIDFALENGEPFEVVAALSGTVRRVEQDPLVGRLVELSHDNGLETVYQSLAEVYVEEGDTVTQGTVLGIAGRNEYEQDLGNHVHFEVRKDGETVSPLEYLQTVAPERESSVNDSASSVREDVHGTSDSQSESSDTGETDRQ
nr:hypothetical protein [Bacillota bacterium]